ncbi:glycosyl hydrolase [Pseudobythopirellula maris]|nr:glycosyl hydrolase [Pseudobythopirellula maris]
MSIRPLTAVLAALLVFATAACPAQIVSSKRGFADVNPGSNELQTLNAGWYYRWGPDKPSSAAGSSAQFVPMIWGGFQANTSTINNILNQDGVEWVLGFNEPERPDQANMSVSQAISSWQTLSSGFSGTGVKLISPGVSDTGEGQAWLADFMGQANSQGLKVDGVAFHWYGASTPNDPIGAANSFISRVDSYHNSYGLPVWITEFAMHDWGGNYSDQEMRAANAIFLDNVVPRLESRSYVGGYSFYNWFGDSTLIEGNPLSPTNVGLPYVGAIRNGEVFDLAGQDLGDNIAYLAGGELTRGGSAPGVVRRIDALSGANKISGSVDWGLAPGERADVRSGASLRKTGINRVTFDRIRLTNDGVIEVAEGELLLHDGPRVTGDGRFVIGPGGKLTFDGSTPSAGGVLSYPVELRGGVLASPVAGGVVAADGSLLSGHGRVEGDLTAIVGSTIRVGAAGLSAPGWFTIEDFDSYAPGNVRDVASPPWTAHENTSLADIESVGGDNALSYGWSQEFRGASRGLGDGGAVEEDDTATVFFRFRSKTDDPDHSLGLGDQATTGGVQFGDYETQIRLLDDPSATGTFLIDARNGGAFTAPLATGLATDEWHNVWMVIDQATDQYDVYLSTGEADAVKLNATPLAFRNGADSALDSFLALAGGSPIDNGALVDDIVYLHGENLTNPLLGGDPGVVVLPKTLTVEGDFVLQSGAVLELDLFDAASHDVLAITGELAAGGMLRVSLDPGAPGLGEGEEIDLLDFTTWSGGFDTIELPGLAHGLVWDASRLATDGVLAVAEGLTGDYNGNGVVDAADFTVWRDSLGQTDLIPMSGADGDGDGQVTQADYALWVANFGAVLDGGAAAIPEPTSLALVLLAASLLTRGRRRQL